MDFKMEFHMETDYSGDYRAHLLGELNTYLERGSMPKMALEHLDDVYKQQYMLIKKESGTAQQMGKLSADLSKAYGDIVIQMTAILKNYSKNTMPQIHIL